MTMHWWLEVAISLAVVALILLTAPWWIPIVGPWIERWLDWTVRKIDQRDQRKEQR
jgi:hypothetical protein